MNKEWSTVEEAAPALGLSKQGMYDAIRKGQLPSEAILRIGKRIRVNLKALSAQVEPKQEKQSECTPT
ncbi:MAG TPA: helix-turn-helix domain-containing protein [Pyrinomonadaceae bacterium]|jgi:excisionase family DNA binding protein